MKIKICFFFLLCLISYQAFAADSTVITPPKVNSPGPLETVTVLHLASSVPRNGTTLYYYPCPPGSQRIKSNFFQGAENQPSANTVGYFFYLCLETYKPQDVYYNKLKNNDWTPCEPATPVPPGATVTYCTIKTIAPPLVRFVAKIPPNDYQTNNNSLLTFRTLSFNLATPTTGKNMNLGQIVTTWSTGGYPPVIPPNTYQGLVGWSLTGKAKVNNGNEHNYSCGGSVIVTNESFGHTYVISCQGLWTLGGDNVYTSNTVDVTIAD
jgi:hypothetical protein